jgi:hypothetical protein
MQVRLRHSLILSVSALTLAFAPVLLQGLPFAPGAAAIAGNGNGNGGDNGGGNGNSGGDHGNSGGNGGGGGGGSSSSDHGNGGGGGNGNSARGGDTASTSPGSNGNGRSKKSSTQSIETADTGESPSSRQRNLKAELGGLNSLKRNINGLMNSSDPRMEGIREYIIASAALATAEEEFEAAGKAFLDAKADYLDLLTDLGLPADTTPASLEEQIANFVVPEDDPLTPDVIEGEAELLEKQALEAALGDIEQSGLWTALVDASDAAQAEADELAEAQAAAGPEAFDKALLMAANKNRQSPDYLTDDIRNWAGNIVDGLVEDYAATQD